MKCCVLLAAMFSFHTFFLLVRQPKLIQLLIPKYLISPADLFTFVCLFVCFFFPPHPSRNVQHKLIQVRSGQK